MLKLAFVENERVCYHLLTNMSQLIREKERQYRFIIPVMVGLRDRSMDDGLREFEQEVTLVLSGRQVKEMEKAVREREATYEKILMDMILDEVAEEHVYGFLDRCQDEPEIVCRLEIAGKIKREVV